MATDKKRFFASLRMTVFAVLLLIPAALCAEDKSPKDVLIRENKQLKKEAAKLKFENYKMKTAYFRQQRLNLELNDELAPIRDLKKKLSGAYADLGAAYAHIKNYDLAIDAYTESLRYDPRNADICYNLGLLYQQGKNNPEKAIAYLGKYLKLKPNARDKKEVEFLINMLSDPMEFGDY
jgi:tetratricopeptide (TPR) repeat protein